MAQTATELGLMRSTFNEPSCASCMLALDGEAASDPSNECKFCRAKVCSWCLKSMLDMSVVACPSCHTQSGFRLRRAAAAAEDYAEQNGMGPGARDEIPLRRTLSASSPVIVTTGYSPPEPPSLSLSPSMGHGQASFSLSLASPGAGMPGNGVGGGGGGGSGAFGLSSAPSPGGPGAGPGSVERIRAVDRRSLQHLRVIQRHLVYVIGLSPSVASEDTLRSGRYFGQYGKVAKVVLNHHHGVGPDDPRHGSASAYITFQHAEDAWSAIKSVDGFVLEGRHIRASFGTTKYCNSFLRNLPCNNPECLYLHELGDEEDRFTKEQIQAGLARHGSSFAFREEFRGSGRFGAPSGTGDRVPDPVLPPPVSSPRRNSSDGCFGGGGGASLYGSSYGSSGSGGVVGNGAGGPYAGGMGGMSGGSPGGYGPQAGYGAPNVSARPPPPRRIPSMPGPIPMRGAIAPSGGMYNGRAGGSPSPQQQFYASQGGPGPSSQMMAASPSSHMQSGTSSPGVGPRYYRSNSVGSAGMAAMGVGGGMSAGRNVPPRRDWRLNPNQQRPLPLAPSPQQALPQRISRERSDPGSSWAHGGGGANGWGAGGGGGAYAQRGGMDDGRGAAGGGYGQGGYGDGGGDGGGVSGYDEPRLHYSRSFDEPRHMGGQDYRGSRGTAYSYDDQHRGAGLSHSMDDRYVGSSGGRHSADPLELSMDGSERGNGNGNGSLPPQVIPRGGSSDGRMNTSGFGTSSGGGNGRGAQGGVAWADGEDNSAGMSNRARLATDPEGRAMPRVGATAATASSDMLPSAGNRARSSSVGLPSSQAKSPVVSGLGLGLDDGMWSPGGGAFSGGMAAAALRGGMASLSLNDGGSAEADGASGEEKRVALGSSGEFVRSQQQWEEQQQQAARNGGAAQQQKQPSPPRAGAHAHVPLRPHSASEGDMPVTGGGGHRMDYMQQQQAHERRPQGSPSLEAQLSGGSGSPAIPDLDGGVNVGLPPPHPRNSRQFSPPDGSGNGNGGGGGRLSSSEHAAGRPPQIYTMGVVTPPQGQFYAANSIASHQQRSAQASPRREIYGSPSGSPALLPALAPPPQARHVRHSSYESQADVQAAAAAAHGPNAYNNWQQQHASPPNGPQMLHDSVSAAAGAAGSPAGGGSSPSLIGRSPPRLNIPPGIPEDASADVALAQGINNGPPGAGADAFDQAAPVSTAHDNSFDSNSNNNSVGGGIKHSRWGGVGYLSADSASTADPSSSWETDSGGNGSYASAKTGSSSRMASDVGAGGSSGRNSLEDSNSGEMPISLQLPAEAHGHDRVGAGGGGGRQHVGGGGGGMLGGEGGMAFCAPVGFEGAWSLQATQQQAS